MFFAPTIKKMKNTTQSKCLLRVLNKQLSSSKKTSPFLLDSSTRVSSFCSVASTLSLHINNHSQSSSKKNNILFLSASKPSSFSTFSKKNTINTSSATSNTSNNGKPPDYDPQKISRNAVVKAIAGNTFITGIKFMAYLSSGSATLLAETCHSLIDSLNQGLLYLGIKQS